MEVIKEIEINKFERELYQYYLEIFPDDERKPLELIRNSYKRGYTKIIEILNNDTLIGFMIINKLNDSSYVVLDYLAILPQYRSKGFGSKAIKLLIENEKNGKGIFIEIEKIGLGKDEKENLLREKRRLFYESLGFKQLNFELILFDVIYMPYVISNIDIDEDEIVEEVLKIYRTVSGDELIKKNCKFIKK